MKIFLYLQAELGILVQDALWKSRPDLRKRETKVRGAICGKYFKVEAVLTRRMA